MGFEKSESQEEKGEKINPSESLEKTTSEPEENISEPEEKTEKELLEEFLPSKEEIAGKEESKRSWGKAAAAGIALAGTLAGGAEAYAGSKDMFDELDAPAERVQKHSPEKKMAEQKAQKAFETVDEGETMAQQAIDHIRDTLLPNETDPSEQAKLKTIMEMPPNKVWSKVFVDKGIVQFGGLYSDPASGKDLPFIFQYKLKGY